MKLRIKSAKPGRTFPGKDGEVQVYEVVAGGAIYDCMNKQIMEYIGKEVECEVKQPSDPKYHATIKLPKSGGNGGGNWGGGKKGYQLAFSQTVEGEKSRAKTMVLAYAKDVVVQRMASGSTTIEDDIKSIKKVYAELLPVLELDKLREQQPQTPAQSGSPGNGNGTLKSYDDLIKEMSGFFDIQAFAKWWGETTHSPSYEALSQENKDKLASEKDKRKAELQQKQQDGKKAPF